MGAPPVPSSGAIDLPDAVCSIKKFACNRYLPYCKTWIHGGVCGRPGCGFRHSLDDGMTMGKAQQVCKPTTLERP